jgi:succinate dehydrogenase/fumarate reductase flavoprotein subunit
VGEVAGTHGVTRPGGAALNAGQVFAIRCAKHISANLDRRSSPAADELFTTPVKDCIARIRHDLKNTNALSIKDVRHEIQARMSDKAGFVCHDKDVATALRQANALNRVIDEKGVCIENPAQIANAMLWRQTALTSEAVLSALNLYISNGGGSRGARLLCSASGTEVPETRTGRLEEYRFLPERDEDKNRQIRVRYSEGKFEVYELALRSLSNPGNFYFEKNWTPFLIGQIYENGYSDSH